MCLPIVGSSVFLSLSSAIIADVVRTRPPPFPFILHSPFSLSLVHVDRDMMSGRERGFLLAGMEGSI